MEQTSKHIVNFSRENKKPHMFTALIICAILMLGLQAIKTTYDNDVWWLLATGREIIQNGFPRTNPWAIHDGMQIVIQQWIPSIILYSLYSVGGMPALEIMLAIQIVALLLLLWKLCRVCADGKDSIVLIPILIAFVSLSGYFSARPQIYTMFLYSLLILVLEKYRKSKNAKILFWLPVITWIHVNVHASMAPFDLFIIFLYWIPDFLLWISKRWLLSFSLQNSDYRRKPLLIAGCISAVSMLINPYGIKGALYLFESYGAAEYRGYISEMNSLIIYSPYGIADLVLIIIGAIIIGKNGKKIDLPLTLLFLSSAFLTIMHVRNCWLVALFSLPLIARGLSDLKLPHWNIRFLHKKAVRLILAVILTDFMFLYAYSNIWPTLVEYINLSKTDSMDLPQKAADWMETYAAENHLQKNEINVFNSFNNGGLLEFRGFKVTMDPRPELWEPSITDQPEHYYQEFVDFSAGDMDIAEMMDKYTYDFYIVRKDSELEKYMNEHLDKYEIAEDCNGYKLWKNT